MINRDRQRRGIESGGDAGQWTARILVLVDQEPRRHLFVEWLEEQGIDVLDSIDDLEAADLCLFDRVSLWDNRTRLHEHKEQRTPEFIPYLLLTPEADSLEVVTRWGVDDVLELPVNRSTFQQRITSLLRPRRLSLELIERSERLDAFASVIAHDVRSPLTVAHGYLERARESGDPADFERVSGALERIGDLVEDVLTLARYGDSGVDPQPISLEAVANEAWRTVDPSCAALTIETDAIVNADRGYVRTLFENLFRNAVEHGGEDVTVRVGATPDGFYVEDDGPGIPEAKRERAFDAGYSSVRGGTGFGLAIVQRIVTAHGWSVRVSPDAGARIEVNTAPVDREER